MLGIILFGVDFFKSQNQKRNAMKGSLNYCKHQVIFKSKRKLSNMFRFKDRVIYDLASGVVHEYTCGKRVYHLSTRE